MVEFEEAALAAATPRADEGGAALTPGEYRALHGGRHMARGGLLCCVRTGALHRRAVLLLEIRNPHGERAADDQRRISVWDRVPEQVLRAAQMVVGFARHGDLQLVLLWRKWRQGGSGLRDTRSGPSCGDRIRRGVFLQLGGGLARRRCQICPAPL